MRAGNVCKDSPSRVQPLSSASRELIPLSSRSATFRKHRATRLRCRAAASVGRDGGHLQTAKDEIAHLAGPKYGTDRSPDIKGAVANIAASLGERNNMQIVDMTDSKWKLVYTESLSSSAGKIGPFVGKVVQEFPKDKPGQYINWLYFGPLAISLLADYKQSGKERIDVNFQYLQVELGIWKWKKDLKAQGTWDSMYIDDSYRVFRANKKNLFILERLSS